MVAQLFDAEGATTVDTALTGANLAIQGSTAQQFIPIISGGGVIKIVNAASAVAGAPIHNTKSYDFNCPSSGTAFGEDVLPGTDTQKKQAVTMYHAAAPSADTMVLVFQGSTGVCMGVMHRATGRIGIVNANAGTTVWVSSPSTGVLTYPCLVTYDCDLDIGTTGTLNTGNGVVHLNVYRHSVSTTVPWASTTDATGTQGANNFIHGTPFIQQARMGINSAAVGRVIADSWRVGDGLGLQGTIESPSNTPPVASIPSGTPATKITGQTVSFTGAATDVDLNTLTYLWVNVSRPAGAPAPVLSNATTLTMTTDALNTPGVYTFSFTANDGLANSNVVTATCYVAAADGSISVKSRRGGSLYVGAVTNLNDANDATVVTSPDASASAIDVWDMNPCAPGDAFTTSGNALNIRARKRLSDGTSDTTATETVTVALLTSVSDTVFATRTLVLTNTITPSGILLTTGESAAFADHNIWAIRVTTTES